MKKLILVLLCFVSISSNSQIREWNSSLDAAKDLATIQDKMILMMWEESTLMPLPVIVNGENGKKIFIEDMLTNEYVTNLIWEYFIPVVVSESNYTELFDEIRDHRSTDYINAFNDDTIKILDVNGNILNVEIDASDNYLNITDFILKYALNTSLIKGELLAYRENKNFYSTFRLAAGYVDMASFVLPKVRPEMIALSDIYFNEAQVFLDQGAIEKSELYLQKINLQKIKQQLVLNKPRKVLRQLKRLDSNILNANEAEIAFLYFTAHLLLNDEKSASEWRNKLSLVNLKKANQIIISNE
ncbi:hypothetical protein WNY78_09710 [Psychroserpens sp. AS72]|uniref:hypothetical protein n=1 Tax=Psychroserpens sp. AS72 TaxID=3135775 RepID=UPI003172C382